MGATTLITMEPEVLLQMVSMHKEACAMVVSLTDKVKQLEEKEWLSIDEVAKMTPYSTSTIRRRKTEIGSKSDEGKLIFKRSAVLEWMARGYNPPKPLPTHKK